MDVKPSSAPADAGTHIAIVLDRSGSMASIRTDVVGGFNTFVASQREVEGSATLTFVQFDSVQPFEVVLDHVPLAGVRPMGVADFVPRGSTPLLDAIGRTILETEHWLAAQPDATRPGKVILVVITDGAENDSREFDLARVRALIQAKEALGWQVVFLSADLGAFAEAHAMGVDDRKRVMFAKNARGNREAFKRTSEKVAAYRRGIVNELLYDADDRDAMADKDVP